MTTGSFDDLMMEYEDDASRRLEPNTKAMDYDGVGKREKRAEGQGLRRRQRTHTAIFPGSTLSVALFWVEKEDTIKWMFKIFPGYRSCLSLSAFLRAVVRVAMLSSEQTTCHFKGDRQFRRPRPSTNVLQGHV